MSKFTFNGKTLTRKKFIKLRTLSNKCKRFNKWSLKKNKGYIIFPCTTKINVTNQTVTNPVNTKWVNESLKNRHVRILSTERVNGGIIAGKDDVYEMI